MPPGTGFFIVYGIIYFHRRFHVFSDCKFGRSSFEYGELPDYDIIFYALGTNDAWWPVDPAWYERDLAEKINHAGGTVYCVLPMYLTDRDTQPYRTAMADVCPGVIDPAEYGVVVSGEGDGIHWDKADQARMSWAITGVLLGPDIMIPGGLIGHGL